MAKLRINRGTTYSRTMTYKEDGVTTSLVGATVFFTMKSAEYDTSADDSTAIVSKTLSGVDLPDAADGLATITLDPEDTDLVEPGDYFYDIKVKKSTGEIYKTDEGTIKLDGSPTNRLS